MKPSRASLQIFAIYAKSHSPREIVRTSGARNAPIVGGKIEGGAPDKVLYYRCPDDMMRGFRIHAGDLLLTVPGTKIQDDAIMLLIYQGRRIVRKVMKLDGGRVLMQAFDREFSSVTAPAKDVQVMGQCVRLQRSL